MHLDKCCDGSGFGTNVKRMMGLVHAFYIGSVNRKRKVFLHLHDVHNGFSNVQLRQMTVVQHSRHRACNFH